MRPHRAGLHPARPVLAHLLLSPVINDPVTGNREQPGGKGAFGPIVGQGFDHLLKDIAGQVCGRVPLVDPVKNEAEYILLKMFVQGS